MIANLYLHAVVSVVVLIGFACLVTGFRSKPKAGPSEHETASRKASARPHADLIYRGIRVEPEIRYISEVEEAACEARGSKILASKPQIDEFDTEPCLHCGVKLYAVGRCYMPVSGRIKGPYCAICAKKVLEARCSS